MRKYNTPLILFFLFVTSCKEETIVSNSEQPVPVIVDLQWGFTERHVEVYFDHELSFYADLSAFTYGPSARFNAYLLRDSHSINVVWRTYSPNSIIQKDSATFLIESANKCYLGLELRDDTVSVKVQDTPFLYL